MGGTKNAVWHGHRNSNAFLSRLAGTVYFIIHYSMSNIFFKFRYTRENAGKLQKIEVWARWARAVDVIYLAQIRKRGKMKN